MTNKTEKQMTVTTGASPAELIQSAVQGGADLDKLEKLLSLQQKWEQNEARKAFHVAMSNFKANPPKIDKDKRVGFSTSKGNVGYSHATLYNVVDKITAELSKHGLSASWRTHQNGAISVTCKITHVLGHSEETSLTADADTSGSKNSIQAIGSTVTYLQRYSLLSILGLATHDQDNDGQNGEKVTDKELHILRDNLIDLEVQESKFCEYMKIDCLENMLKTDYQKAINALEVKREAKKKAVEKKAVKQ